MRRGQVTLFVILAIVLAIVIGMAFLVRNTTGNRDLNTQVQETVQTITEDQSINFFVQSCLNNLVQEATTYIGLQGGVIFVEQGGLTPRQGLRVIRVHNGTAYEVMVGITNETPKSPGYPQNNTLLLEVTDPVFGVNRMQKLCDYNGPNAPYISDGSVQSCEIFTSYNYENPDAPTIQNQIEHFLEEKMPACVDLSTFELVYEKNITTGNPNATVLMTANSFQASVHYPVTISQGDAAQTSLAVFVTESRVPLQEIYNLAFAIAERETYDIDFSPGQYTNYTSLAFWVPGLQVYRLRHSKHFHVLQVQDTRTLVNGKPYTYQFAVQNRKPAINLFNLTGQDTYQILLDDFGEGDQFDSINITPFAVDPDDEPVNYTYSGWQETYSLNAPDLAQIADYALYKTDSSTTKNDWLNLRTKVENPGLHVLTRKEPYLRDERSINISATSQDFGLHTIRIIVQDNRNPALTDWQDIYVFVRP